MMKPWENISYFGNQKIISQLDTLYENDKLNSTLLFNGSYGLGKATLAFRFSNYILNQKTEKFTSFTIKNNPITNLLAKFIAASGLTFLAFDTKISINFCIFVSFGASIALT